MMDAQWLKTQFRLNPGKAKADLAKSIGLDPPAVSKILSGSRQIKAQEYIAMRRFFGLPVERDNPSDKSATYTLRPLSHENGLEDSNVGKKEPEWIIPASILSKRTQAPPEKIKIFQIRESVMEPDFHQGEHVLVDMSDQKPSPPGVFIISDGFGHMVRNCAFIPKTDPPEVEISACANGFRTHVLKLNEFAIIGRVIAKLQII